MNPALELLLTSIALGAVIGLPIGWIARSLFISREIQRAHRDAWKQARTIHRHGGTI
jgi:NhaP-type Na+/H+ or K+/H+ antiporter